MPKISPNFNDATQPNKAGTYICKIILSEARISPKSGNPYICWKLATVPENRFVYYNTTIVGKGAGMFKHMVNCAGDTAYKQGDYDTDVLNGKMVEMNLDLDERGYYVVSSVSALPQMIQTTQVPGGMFPEDDIDF